MRKIITILSAIGLGCAECILIGCGKSDNHLVSTSAKSSPDEAPSCTAVDFVSAEDLVNAQLEKMGLSVGYDKSRGAMIVVAAHETELKDPEKFNEAFRQVAFRKAMVDATCEIARMCNGGVTETGELNDKKGAAISSTVKVRGKMNLHGLTVLLSAESYDTSVRIYQHAVAVVWSKKLEAQSKAIISEEISASAQRPGSKSILEWIGGHETSLGARTFVDNVGDRWMIGIVSVDDAMRRYTRKWFDGSEPQASVEYTLRAYALDGISKIICSDVMSCSECSRRCKHYDENSRSNDVREDSKDSAGKIIGERDETGAYQGDDVSSEMLESTYKKGDMLVLSCGFGDAGETLRDRCSVRTDFRIDPSNARLKWFVRKTVNPISKKDIEVWIGAIRCNDIAIGEKELYSNATSRKHEYSY